MHKTKLKDYSMVVRNFTFGVEDSLVSTVGLLAGIAVADISRSNIIVTGLVLIFVEAFSMGVGSLLSEQSVEEYQVHKQVSLAKPAVASVVMFVSYVLAGLIPLAPYFYETKHAVGISIGLTLFSLLLLGVFNAKMFRVSAWRDGLFTLIMGGLAILVGIAVGQIAGHF
jgi:VIT1/CCC1 family predicted Fe2+/Mn2+ transporter